MKDVVTVGFERSGEITPDSLANGGPGHQTVTEDEELAAAAAEELVAATEEEASTSASAWLQAKIRTAAQAMRLAIFCNACHAKARQMEDRSGLA